MTVPADVCLKTQEGANHEEEFDGDESISVDLNDVVHDDLIGDLLIRFMSSPLIDDPYWVKNGANRNMPAPAYLDFTITYDEIVHLCTLASASFLEQPALIQINKEDLPLHIVADLHGCLTQVLRLFRYCGSPHKETFLFLGDYVDRGVQGVELITLLFCLKVRYPTQVYLLRGNHEDANTTLNYGFFDECLFKWPILGSSDRNGDKIWRLFLSVFNCMPVAAIVAGTIFCAHGGISPFIKSLDDINKIKRPSVVPAYGIGCDLLWSDPSTLGDGWILSHRGISFLFGQKAVDEFCLKHNVDIILRGHQINNEMYKNGYRISFDGRLVTLFSAPNYMNYKNNSCIVTVSERLNLKFTVFRCRYYQIGKKTPNQKEKNQKKNINKGDEEEEHSESCGPSPRSSCEQFFSMTPMAPPEADRTGPKANTTAPITNTTTKVVSRDGQKHSQQASRDS